MLLNRSLIIFARQKSLAGNSLIAPGEYQRQLRLVATTTPSKIQQLASQQRKELTNESSSSEQASQVTELQQITELKHQFEARLEQLPLWHSVETIKRLGHRLARLDPLGLQRPETLEELAWNHSMIDKLKSSSDIVATNGFLDTKQPLMAVNELLDAVWNIYAANECGLEFAHLSNQQEIEWLTSQWERLNECFHLDSIEQDNLAKLLLECEAFDHFMAAKYPTTKRYGCEGAESMLAVFDEILRLCHLGEAEMDEMTRSIGQIDDVIIGMPHRGRLNLLCCLLGFEPRAIFAKTAGEPELDLLEAWMAKGDVLSHLSTNVRFVYGLDRQHIGLSRDTPNPINVSLLPNPSHLEVSSPMVAGVARGRALNQFHNYSSSPKFPAATSSRIENAQNSNKRILPIQVHGDASLAGQGIIQETLQMANLPQFTVGGSLHLVVNNQIGYTTSSSTGRSSRYCTDIFKSIEAPIIHVSAQNIPSVIRATRLALTYRQKFGKDVAIDLIGYRQHGRSDIVATNGFLDTKQPLMAVNELLDAVWNIYAANECGLEFAHLSNQQEIEWLTSQWERLNECFHLDSIEQDNLAKLLLECEAFDHFMAAKYPTTKRYGCEGAESMLAVFDEILRLCHLGEAEMDEMTRSIGQIDDVIIGMPHRGRLNLLCCLLGFEPRAIFAKTAGEPELDLLEAWMAKGDVLSHLSTNVRFVYGLDRQHIGLSRDTPNPINVSLLPNPSHLEVSSPMVAGVARGRALNQFHNYSSSPKFPAATSSRIENAQNSNKRILPIQVHGDASLAGQGIIQETLQMANLPQFTVGGSLHLVVNNQIGYTTSSSTGRSSRYCTDIFKSIEAPIIHVSAQNIPSVIRATRLALTYRQKFGKDVAIDLIGYRQHGHNEMDEPTFTQPVMYDRIKSRKSIPQTYCDSIQFEPEKRVQINQVFKDKLQEAFKTVKSFKPDNDNYRNFSLATEFHRDHICSWQTGFDLELLKSIALASVQTPAEFKLHPTLKRVLVDERRKRFAQEKDARSIPVDWATAEILAFGSLLKQNNSVRLAGQDVARGTFSTRHAILFDQSTESPYIPLNNMPDSGSSASGQRAKLEVANTILSEEAALAYEFGFSTETCALTIWEAQFGDFFNTAQSIIDTLISSSEAKWLKQSPITLLLPHGLDGAGPEHSSAHLERFLQLSSSSLDSIDTEAKCNWSVCFPTMPSQYFHLLRRQVLRPFRKPLIVMAPKVIFRHPDCVSQLAHFEASQCFEPVLDDPTVENRNLVDTLVLCSGKVYFSLKEEKLRQNLNNLAILRIEELCPFPVQALARTIKQYPSVKPNKFVWFQEEHKNQGAFSFVEQRLANMTGIRLRYIGRPESELPATGSSSLHKRELEQLTKEFNSLNY